MAGLTIDDLIARADPAELDAAVRRRIEAASTERREREARQHSETLVEELNAIGAGRRRSPRVAPRGEARARSPVPTAGHERFAADHPSCRRSVRYAGFPEEGVTLGYDEDGGYWVSRCCCGVTCSH